MADFDLAAALQRAPINPESFQRVGLEFLSSKLNGNVLVDVNAPAIHLLEASASMAAYHIQENMALDRRHYRLLAQTYEDLYGHMADADYLNRFSEPGKVVLQYTVALDNVIAAMTQVPDTNVRRVVIPRYSEIRPGGEYPLTLLYPIEIRQLPHDGLQVVFNTDKESPIQTLSDNILAYRIIRDRTDQQTKYLQIDIPIYQLSRQQSSEVISVGSSRYAFSFTGKYFYTRVFQGTEGNWKEMATTHSLQVYDATTPTVVLQVADGVLNVTIPPIYYSMGTVTGNLRVDIYTTLGEINQDLTNYAPEKYQFTFNSDADDPDLDDYSVSLPSLPFAWTSVDTISGGADGLTFEELRERSIYNVTSTQSTSPITPAQIEARLNRLGFDVVKSRDDMTSRLYLATVDTPKPPTSRFSSGIGVSVSTLQASMENLTRLKGVYDNGERITLGPDMLFSLNGGVLGTVDNTHRPDVLYKTPEAFVNGVNQSNYAFTPYHYVMDATGDTFGFRAYYLQNPKQLTRRYIRDNPTLLVDVSTSGFAVTRTTKGYRLTVTLTAGETYLAIPQANRHLQLAFIPAGETNYAYLNGTYLGATGKTVVWAFEFETNFDIDSSDNLIVNNFSIFEAESRKLALPLETEFMLLTAVSGDVDDGYQYNAIDALLGDFLLPDDTKAISQEFVTLRLGTTLDNLWRGARTVAGSYQYQSYSAVVYDYYSEDIYEMDEATNSPKFTIVDGKVELVVLHQKGEQKKDVNGNPIVLHKAGDPVLDSQGNPVPLSVRPVIRLVDLLVMDGNYSLVNQDSDLTDLTWTADNLANTQLAKLTDLSKVVLEKTTVSLYPKKSIGSIPVLIDDGIEKVIDSALTFTVVFYLTGTAYRDTEYRSALQTLTAQILNTGIRQDTISVSTLVTLLKPQLDENVVGFDINMYSNGTEMTTFTCTDSSVQPSIERVMEYTQDGKFAVRENIEFLFKNHEKR